MKQALKIFFGLSILAFSLSLLDARTMLDALSKTSISLIITIYVLCVISIFFTALRWVVIIRDQTSATTSKIIRSYLLSNLLNSVTPANLGGDVYRFCTLTKDVPLERPRILGALLKEKLLGLLGYIISYLVGWGFWYLLNPYTPPAAIAMMHSTGTMLLLVFPVGALAMWLITTRWINVSRLPWESARRWLEGTVCALAFVSKRDTALLTLLSLCGVVAWIAAIILYADALHSGLSWPIIMMISVMVELARYVPVSIQGVGVREGLYAALFALCGASSEIGFAVGAVIYLVLGLAMLTAGLLGLIPEKAPRE